MTPEVLDGIAYTRSRRSYWSREFDWLCFRVILRRFEDVGGEGGEGCAYMTTGEVIVLSLARYAVLSCRVRWKRFRHGRHWATRAELPTARTVR